MVAQHLCKPCWTKRYLSSRFFSNFIFIYMESITIRSWHDSFKNSGIFFFFFWFEIYLGGIYCIRWKACGGSGFTKMDVWWRSRLLFELQTAVHSRTTKSKWKEINYCLQSIVNKSKLCLRLLLFFLIIVFFCFYYFYLVLLLGAAPLQELRWFILW